MSRSDNLWFDRWNEVLFVQPEWVEIISWNDYGMSVSLHILPQCASLHHLLDNHQKLTRHELARGVPLHRRQVNH